MWILETEPPRLLAPNKTYTFGRRSHRKDADFISFDGSSISRNHLTIQVGEPKIGDFAAITQVKLTDLKSKFGTEANKEPLGRGSKSFECAKLELQLGPSTHVNLVWKPINITYGTGEQDEAHKLMWERALGILKPLDIKLSASFTPQTTHYLKGTHRTSKLALALAYNLPVINTQFLQTLTAVGHALEEDFRQWPDESQFLEDPLWAPNPQRATCFINQNFVVYEDNQFNNLKVVIEAAGGSIKLVKVNEQIADTAILIKPKDRLLLKHTTASIFTEHSDILNSIKVAKPVIPSLASGTSQAHESSMDQNQKHLTSQTTRARPQKAGLMSFLTQKPPKAQSTTAEASTATPVPQCLPEHPVTIKMEDDSTASTQQRKRPARVTMMDFMVGKRQKLDSETQAEPSPSVSQPVTQPLNTKTVTLSKRKRVDDEDTQRGHSRPVVTDAPTREPSNAPETSVSEQEQASQLGKPDTTPFVDLDTNISGLALVECTLSIIAKPHKVTETSPAWQGKPNFKAFRRKSDKITKLTPLQKHQPNLSLGVGVFPGSQPNSQQVTKSPSPPGISFIDDVDKLPTREQDPDADNEFGFKFTS